MIGDNLWIKKPHANTRRIYIAWGGAKVASLAVHLSVGDHSLPNANGIDGLHSAGGGTSRGKQPAVSEKSRHVWSQYFSPFVAIHVLPARLDPQ